MQLAGEMLPPAPPATLNVTTLPATLLNAVRVIGVVAPIAVAAEFTATTCVVAALVIV